MPKSKHRKGFKEKQQKNRMKKISDKKLLDHRMKKYRELMMVEFEKQQMEQQNSASDILPTPTNESEESFMDALESVEPIQDAEVIETEINTKEQ